jgi:hypothetical protein
MSVIARRVASVPVRTASDTWRAICDLLTRPDDPVRVELDSVANLACMIIAEEYTSTAPIVVTGAGPQIRIRTAYGDDAVGADDDEGGPVYRSLSSADWNLSFPVGDMDISYARQAVASLRRFTVRELDSPLPTSADAGKGVTVDLKAASLL